MRGVPRGVHSLQSDVEHGELRRIEQPDRNPGGADAGVHIQPSLCQFVKPRSCFGIGGRTGAPTPGG